jgi:hypothetical protein
MEEPMQCSRCFTALYMCHYCEGQTKKSLLGDTLTCKTCRSTGWLCPEHEGFWE